jgi:hypothetical protein
MATRKTTNSALISTQYLNRNLSQDAQEALDKVNASSNPCYSVSWTDLYRIFQNSRWLAREANQLGSSADDGYLQALIAIMRRNHACLRRVLFLVAIENLFNCGRENAMHVLCIYLEQLECADQINERLAEAGEEIAQVQARLEAVCA